MMPVHSRRSDDVYLSTVGRSLHQKTSVRYRMSRKTLNCSIGTGFAEAPTFPTVG